MNKKKPVDIIASFIKLNNQEVRLGKDGDVDNLAANIYYTLITEGRMAMLAKNQTQKAGCINCNNPAKCPLAGYVKVVSK